MSTYTVIEDASPYFVKFTFPGLDDLIAYIKSIKPEVEYGAMNYFHRIFSQTDAQRIISKLPMKDQFEWVDKRLTIFSTPPGRCCAIHKDGNAFGGAGKFDAVGLNIPLTILDDKCVTSWYSDSLFDVNKNSGWPYCYSKVLFEPNGYDNLPKLKQMTMQPNEMILFNSSIYHSWENNKSKNLREILTFRFKNGGDVTFEQARKILFNI